MTQPALPPHVAQAGLPFLLLDTAGHILTLNSAALTLFGRPAEALSGMPFVELVDPFSREKAVRLLHHVLAAGIADDWELNHPQVDAPPALLSYTAWLFRPTPDAPQQIAALGRPIDAATSLAATLATTNQQLEGTLLQLERAHAELKAAQTQLVRSEKMRALGQLVAGVAHEVNTPLAFVANNLEFLAERLTTLQTLHARYHELAAAAPALAAQFEAADNAADAASLWMDLAELPPESAEGITRIATIVRALRTFARPDDPGIQSADLNAGLASTVRIARTLCPGGVTIAEQYAALPLVVCNPGEINQVILNLLSNAILATTPPGVVTVSSAVETLDAVIMVHDHGAGMDEATLARLGEPFFTTRPVGSGTGLGIAISRGIAERHGGRLEFTSAPARGTTARLTLPIEPRSSARMNAAPQHP